MPLGEVSHVNEEGVELLAPRQAPRVFLSYNHEDKAQADRLRGMLAEQRLDVWMDAEIAPGTSWREQIDTALRTADAVVVLVSPASSRNSGQSSEVVAAIAARLADPQKLVVPARTGPDVDLPVLLQDVQALDLSAPTDVVERRIRDLADRLRRESPREVRDPGKSLDLLDMDSFGLLVERQMYHRLALERERHRLLLLGQVLAFLTALSVFAVSITLILSGHALLGTALSSVVVAALATAFVSVRGKV